MDRAAMAWKIIDELLGSCPDGEAIDTEKVLSQYPDLKPELQEELVKVKRI